MSKPISFFLLLIVASIQIVSAASDQGKIEITAKHVDSVGGIVTAKDDVVVYYEDSVIKASSAKYDKSKKLLVLDGNIEIIGYKGTKEHSNHIEISTETKEVTFDELFLMSKNDVWLFTEEAHRKDTNYTLGTSQISSCDLEDHL